MPEQKAAVKKQLTVRGVDAALEQRLRAEAEQRGLSLNQTVLQLLRRATGLETESLPGEPSVTTRHFTDLDHLAGRWTPEEADAFDAVLREMRGIDAEMWR